MNKRITSIVLCLVLLVSLMAVAVPVSAEPVVYLGSAHRHLRRIRNLHVR